MGDRKGTDGCFTRTDVLATSSTLIYCMNSGRMKRILMVGTTDEQEI